jgi:hypothetical protein
MIPGIAAPEKRGRRGRRFLDPHGPGDLSITLAASGLFRAKPHVEPRRRAQTPSSRLCGPQLAFTARATRRARDHRSRFSFRFPQCVSLRELSNARFDLTFLAQASRRQLHGTDFLAFVGQMPGVVEFQNDAPQ